MKRSYKSEFSDLRQKAEELLITKISKSDSPLSENDTLKLIHELEVHQIELELQNKELNLARSAALLTAEKFTELYDFSPTSYFSLSKDGRIVELNLEGAKMLGKERSLFIDKVFGLFVSSDTKQRFGLFLKQVFTSNAKETCEVTLLTGDGTQMVVLLTGIPTENGKQCLLSVVDITERKRLDSIIKTRNSILELSYHCSLDELLQKTLDAVEILSQSKISFFHFVEEDQVTLSLQTWSTNTLQKMCSADGKDQHYPIDQAGVWVDCIAARSPVIHNDYLSLPHRKGLPVGHAPVIRELVVPILRNEKIVAILGVGNKESNYDQTDVQSISEVADIVLDIAERKKGEEALRISNEFNQSLLQTIPFGMDIVDEFGNILYLSEKIKQHFGDDSLGKKCWDLYRDDKKQCSDCPLHSGINVGETKTNETNGVLDGKTFEIYHTGIIFHGQKAMLEAFIDITKRKLAEDELIIAKEHAEESDRLKSAFLANMSHEIRTPMNGVLGFAELLKEPKLSDEEQKKYISVIQRSGNRLLSIINDIVDISKIEAGQMENSLSEVNVNEKIQDTYNFFKHQTNQKGIHFSCKSPLPSAQSIIKTDNEKLYAILTNLVNNAIKFTNSGSIEFGYIKRDVFLEFYVKDTGIGISEANKDIIFERFRQGGKISSKTNEGTGLGLSISKAFVEMLGGKIWVESEEGQGSEFYFTIPYITEKQVENNNQNIHPIEEESGQIKNLKILIAEDDETSDFLITSILNKNSHKLLHATTGNETIEVCRNHPNLDLVLMDIRMADMSGLETTRRIRQFNMNVIIIAQTADALTDDREKAISAGCNDYISKPIDKEKLKALIQKYFKV